MSECGSNHYIFKQDTGSESRWNGLARQKEEKFSSFKLPAKSWRKQEGGRGGRATEEAAVSDSLNSKGKPSQSSMGEGLGMLRGQRGGPQMNKGKAKRKKDRSETS